MKYLIIIPLLFTIFIPKTKAQQTTCDSIYTFTSLTKAATIPSDEDYSSITDKWIVPILAELNKEYQIFVTNFRLKLVINEQGQISQGEFTLGQIPAPYRQKIIDSLIQNTEWEPAEIDEVPVCSILIFPVSCLRWRE